MKGSVIDLNPRTCERRSFFRKNISAPVTITIGNRTLEARTVDISNTGLGVKDLDEFRNVTLGELNDIRNRPIFIHLHEPALDIRAQLAWLDCATYHAGFIIKDISDGDRWDELCTPDQVA